MNRQGIPTYAGTREGYFATQEIGVLLDYLRVLDNRRQDIPLAAVLRSPFGELTEMELASIKSVYRDNSFHQAVTSYCAEGKDSVIRGKLEKCLKKMDEFRSILPYTPMHELLWKILEAIKDCFILSVILSSFKNTMWIMERQVLRMSSQIPSV